MTWGLFFFAWFIWGWEQAVGVAIVISLYYWIF